MSLSSQIIQMQIMARWCYDRAFCWGRYSRFAGPGLTCVVNRQEVAIKVFILVSHPAIWQLQLNLFGEIPDVVAALFVIPQM